MPHQPHCVYRQRSPVKTKCQLKQQTTNYSIIPSILFSRAFSLLALPSHFLAYECRVPDFRNTFCSGLIPAMCVCVYFALCFLLCICVFDYLTAFPWFMCLGPVRAVLSLCEKNHSFPRVEDERVFRLQTPVGLCGLDCFSLFLHCRVIYSLKKKNSSAVASVK